MMQQRFWTLVCKHFRYPLKDAKFLSAELKPPPLASVQAAQADPPPPEMPSRSPPSDLHSIPLEVIPEKSDLPSEDPPLTSIWK